MADRYDLSDRLMYGAENDDDLDHILDALDRAHVEPRAWDSFLAAGRVAASSLTAVTLPESPGVYVWLLEGNPQYVGMATSLRQRVWGKHLAGGMSLAGSSLRRNVCELLFGIPPRLTAKPVKQKVTQAQADSIRAWLLRCDLAWVECVDAREADSLERRLRRESMPPLNRV